MSALLRRTVAIVIVLLGLSPIFIFVSSPASAQDSFPFCFVKASGGITIESEAAAFDAGIMYDPVNGWFPRDEGDGYIVAGACAPATEEPVSTEPVETLVPVTESPATEPVQTEEPWTEVPATETVAPSTEPVETAMPTDPPTQVTAMPTDVPSETVAPSTEPVETVVPETPTTPIQTQEPTVTATSTPVFEFPFCFITPNGPMTIVDEEAAIEAGLMYDPVNGWFPRYEEDGYIVAGVCAPATETPTETSTATATTTSTATVTATVTETSTATVPPSETATVTETATTTAEPSVTVTETPVVVPPTDVPTDPGDGGDGVIPQSPAGHPWCHLPGIVQEINDTTTVAVESATTVPATGTVVATGLPVTGGGGHPIDKSNPMWFALSVAGFIGFAYASWEHFRRSRA